jgi:uncharacterized membrane protein
MQGLQGNYILAPSDFEPVRSFSLEVLRVNFGYLILGMIVGGVVAGSGSFLIGVIGGAFIGVLLARLSGLEKRIKQLESEEYQVSAPIETKPVETRVSPEPVSAPETTSSPQPTGSFEARPPDIPDPWQKPETSKAPAKPSLVQKGFQTAFSWLSTGNVPVKIGIIVTFIGVSFLLKYAIDRELLVFPIEARLLAVAAAGLAMIVIGWRLREKVRVYGLSLQGGGAGILFLTIFAAFRLFELIPEGFAFFALVALTFGTGALAVTQNSRWLAILGMTGGFLAPILTSTGQGSHVALFSYYLILWAFPGSVPGAV